MSSSTANDISDDSPIGVFDSGIGGLSNLRALMQAMPQRRFIYLADIAYAPYGERTDAYIVKRSQKIARWMHDEQKTCGLIIACNTATAAAAQTLRDTYQESWPIVAVEPGLKPAAIQSKTGRIAIMATASTLKSAKFQTLLKHAQEYTQTPLITFLCPCDGLAAAIDDDNNDRINALIKLYTSQVKATACDVVVLGCTHYSLVADRIAQALPGIHILDTSQAVAHRALAVFPLQTSSVPSTFAPELKAWTSGNVQQLQKALTRWLPHTVTQTHFWSQEV